MKLNIAHDFLPKVNSARASMVMDHFGIEFETGQHVIASNLELELPESGIVLFTGESGSGKSSMMRATAAQLTAQGRGVINVDELDLGEEILVNSLDLPFAETLQLLASCGLGESHLLLRTPAELSDGQRYRFRLAKAVSLKPAWILADEFTATLDRKLAQVVAFNLHRISSRTGIGFLLATTHDDIVDDLAPDVHVATHLSGEIFIDEPRSDSSKKKLSRSATACGSPPRPNPTGRTSLGGITAAIASD